MSAHFEVGKTYSTRSLADHDCMVSITVERRTKMTITTTDGKTFRCKQWPGIDEGAEFIHPWGRYSLCPILSAKDVSIK